MNPVLIIIDMQKDFFKKDELVNQQERLVSSINELIASFRGHDKPIVWIKQTWKADLTNAQLGNKRSSVKMVIEGTEGNELLDGLDFNKIDYLVTKTQYSGFFNTNLDELLKKIKADKLVVCGINTHACVRMTVIDAYQRYYNVIVAKDCVASYDQAHHEISLKYFSPTIAEVKSNQEIAALLN